MNSPTGAEHTPDWINPRSQGTPEEVTPKDRLQKILRWSSQNTAELRQERHVYVQTKAERKLFNSLVLSTGSLYRLEGLQGVGKTTCLRQVANRLRESFAKAPNVFPIMLKWSGGPDAFERAIFLANEQVPDYCKDDVFGVFSWYGDAPVTWEGSEEIYPDEAALHGWLDQYSSNERRYLFLRLLAHYLRFCHTVLIDLRDFSISDRRAMTKDLAEIADLWTEMLKVRVAVEDKPMPNIVVAFQKELIEDESGRVTNYFAGKLNRIVVESLPAEALVRLYKKEFDSFPPFTEEALLYLARLSRGIPRRFLTYVHECLIEKIGPGINYPSLSIDFATVRSTLGPNNVVDELRAELMSIFPKGERWKTATLILTRLYSEGPILQKDLVGTAQPSSSGEAASQAPVDEISKMDLSRILPVLEEHGLIRRKAISEGNLVMAAGTGQTEV